VKREFKRRISFYDAPEGSSGGEGVEQSNSPFSQRNPAHFTTPPNMNKLGSVVLNPREEQSMGGRLTKSAYSGKSRNYIDDSYTLSMSAQHGSLHHSNQGLGDARMHGSGFCGSNKKKKSVRKLMFPDGSMNTHMHSQVQQSPYNSNRKSRRYKTNFISLIFTERTRICIRFYSLKPC
jgi:hypothetical protein